MRHSQFLPTIRRALQACQWWWKSHLETMIRMTIAVTGRNDPKPELGQDCLHLHTSWNALPNLVPSYHHSGCCLAPSLACKVTDAFVDTCITLSKRVLNVPELLKLLLSADEEQADGNPFNSWAKLQILVQKSKTTKNINWSFNALHLEQKQFDQKGG